MLFSPHSRPPERRDSIGHRKKKRIKETRWCGNPQNKSVGT